MEKFELKVTRFNNSDVIATSGGSTPENTCSLSGLGDGNWQNTGVSPSVADNTIFYNSGAVSGLNTKTLGQIKVDTSTFGAMDSSGWANWNGTYTWDGSKYCK